MRKTTTTLVIAAALFLGACGGDDATTDEGNDQSTSTETEGVAAEDEAAEGEDAEGEDAGAAGGDLDAALLTAEDLPEGVEVSPMDIAAIADMSTSMAGMLEDITYEPAECAENTADPLSQEGVNAAGLTATSADMSQVLVSAVFENTGDVDLKSVEDHLANCGEVAITGSMGEQPIDMVTTTTVVEAPDVDADEVLAMETTTAMAGAPSTPFKIVYVVDGDHGIYVAGDPASTTFDLDALISTALERKREALG